MTAATIDAARALPPDPPRRDLASERDRKLDAQVVPYETGLRALVARADPASPASEQQRLRWMIEEFRLSLFAQELRTLGPVSARRLEEQLRLARG